MVNPLPHRTLPRSRSPANRRTPARHRGRGDSWLPCRGLVSEGLRVVGPTLHTPHTTSRTQERRYGLGRGRGGGRVDRVSVSVVCFSSVAVVGSAQLEEARGGTARKSAERAHPNGGHGEEVAVSHPCADRLQTPQPQNDMPQEMRAGPAELRHGAGAEGHGHWTRRQNRQHHGRGRADRRFEDISHAPSKSAAKA